MTSNSDTVRSVAARHDQIMMGTPMAMHISPARTISVLLLVLFAAAFANDTQKTPWPAQYKVAAWEHKRITPADCVGPDGIVYPDFRLAGVEGGIPDVSDWKQFDITAYPGTDDDARFDGALAAAIAAGGGVIHFPKGTYTMSREHRIEHGHVVIAGAGKHETIIEIGSGSGKGSLFMFESKSYSKYRTPISKVPRGTTRIQVESVKGYGKGDWIRLTATKKGATMTQRYDRPEIGLKQPNASSFGRTYFARVAAMDPETNTFTFDRPTHHEYYADEGLQIRKVNFLEFCGVQDLTLNTPSPKGAIKPIGMKGVCNGWMKNIVLRKSENWPFTLGGSIHIEVRNSEFLGTWAKINRGGQAYLSISGWYGGSYNLMTNCRGRDLRHMAIFQWGNTSVVRDCVFSGKTTQSPQLHGRHPYDNLIEQTTFTCSSFIGAYSIDANMTTRHGSEGPRMVFYNNVHSGSTGHVQFSFVENHIIAYNTFINKEDKHLLPGVHGWNKAFDAIIRGNSFEIAPYYPVADLQDAGTVGWEIYDNQVYGSNGYVWEGDGNVMRHDNNRVYPPNQPQEPAVPPEASSIYLWQKEHADAARLLLLIDKGAITEKGGKSRVRLIRIRPKADPTAGELLVTLRTSDPSLSLPETIAIPDGQNYVDFEIAATDDEQAQGHRDVELTAVADGYLQDVDRIELLDDESALPRFAKPRPDRFANGPKPGWAAGDFGRTSAEGSTEYDAENGRFTLNGAGIRISRHRGIHHPGRHFCYRALRGDGEIIARVVSTDDKVADVGIMVVDDPSHRTEAFVLTADKAVYQWGRKHHHMVGTLQSPKKRELPVWLRITREGAVFRAWTSASPAKPAEDEWQLLHELDFYQEIKGSYKAMAAIDDVMYFGLFVNSGQPETRAAAVFDNIQTSAE